MSQYEIILKAMLNNKNKVWWTASDFQQGENFVGYEATARMSELKTKYLGLFNEKKIGRFRALSINPEYDLKEFEYLMK